jgi:hypothetical protein
MEERGRLAWFVDHAARQATAMKILTLAVATAFTLISNLALAQTAIENPGMNGATLGNSMPGATAGVPYPRPAEAYGSATSGTSAGESTPRAFYPKRHRHHRAPQR